MLYGKRHCNTEASNSRKRFSENFDKALKNSCDEVHFLVKNELVKCTMH